MNRNLFILDYETTGVGTDDLPIEVGVLVCDPAWKILDSYETLISSPELDAVPEDRWAAAQAFHGITREMLAGGPRPGELGVTLSELPHTAKEVALVLADRAQEFTVDGRKPVLVSDNIQFEWRHTGKLLASIGMEVLDVFHYCGWDTSLLSMFTSFEDPLEPEHRALSDALGLHKELARLHAELRGPQWHTS